MGTDRESARIAVLRPLGEATYRRLVELAPDAVVVADEQGRIVLANEQTSRIFGYAPEELLGRPVEILLPERFRKGHVSHRGAYRASPAVRPMGAGLELFGRRKDGTEFAVEISLSPVQLSEGMLVASVIRDITDRRRIEAELQVYRKHLEEQVDERTAQLEETHEQLRLADRLAAIGTLAAGLGHDMNNVLFPVRCRLDVLERRLGKEAGDKEAAEGLRAVRESVDYLQRLSDGLHLLALDPDVQEPTTGDTNLAEWWEHAGPILRKSVGKHASFRIDIPAVMPHVGVAPHLLTQAVLNLVINARDAVAESPDPGEIRLTAKPLADGRFIRLTVSDNGCGMTEEVRRRALEPFFTTKRRGLGTGLGLALVHGMVQSAGGTVEIESQPGRGTEVRLILPTVEPQRDHGKLRPVACTSIPDPRLASLVMALLDASDFEVIPVSGSPTEASSLWVATATPQIAKAAIRYLDGDPGRRVVLLGGNPTSSSERLTAVKDAQDYEAIRAGIGGAITGEPA